MQSGVTVVVPELHLRSLDVTLVTELLLRGSRAQVNTSSVLFVELINGTVRVELSKTYPSPTSLGRLNDLKQL